MFLGKRRMGQARYHVTAVAMFCFVLLGVVRLDAHADETLSSLLRVRSDSDQGEQNKALTVLEAKLKITEKQREYQEEVRRDLSQRLTRELAKLEKLTLSIQISPKKWYLYRNEKIRKLRQRLLIQEKRLRGLYFRIQTAQASVLEDLSSLQTKYKRFETAFKSVNVIVKKRFPQQKAEELRLVMEQLEGRISKAADERKATITKRNNYNKKLKAYQRRLILTRKKMFEDPPAKPKLKKDNKPDDIAQRKRALRKLSASEEARQERDEEILQTTAQIQNVLQQILLMRLAGFVDLFQYRKRDETLTLEELYVDKQLYLLTMKSMKALAKKYASQEKGGLLYYSPLDFRGKWFSLSIQHTKRLFKEGPAKVVGMKTSPDGFAEAYKKMGLVKFAFWFFLLPIFLLVLLVLEHRWTKRRIAQLAERIRESKTVMQLRRVRLLSFRLLHDTFPYVIAFSLIYILLVGTPLAEAWESLLFLIAILMVLVRLLWSLANELFAKEAKRRFLRGVDKDNAHRFRRFLKFLAMFSLMYFPFLRLLTSLKYPDSLVELLQTFFFVVVLGWLLFGFFRPSTLKKLFDPVKRRRRKATQMIMYRVYPLILISLTVALVVHLLGYSNFAYYLAVGLSWSVSILGAAYVLFQFLMLFASWFLAIDNPDEQHRGMIHETRVRILRVSRVLLSLTLMVLSLGFLLEAWDILGGFSGIFWLLDYPLLSVQKTQLSLLSILKFIAVFGATLWLSKKLQQWLSVGLYPSLGFDTGTQAAINTVVGYVMLTVGLLLALQVMGVGIGVLTIFAGAIGIGLGFGLRDIASNFISGLILIFGRPISVGDVIELKGQRGVVRAISARSTTMETIQGHTILVPNAKLITSQVVNLSVGPPFIRLSLAVGVAYDSDLDLVRQTLLNVVAENEKVLQEPPPSVAIKDFGDNNIVFSLTVSSNNFLGQGGVLNSLRDSIAVRFREKGITMAFPQKDLHLDPAVEEAFSVIKDYILQSKQPNESKPVTE